MEEMDYVFGVSTRRHMHHQVREVIPWYWTRYVLRWADPLPREDRLQREKPLAPLYRWDIERENVEIDANTQGQNESASQDGSVNHRRQDETV